MNPNTSAANDPAANPLPDHQIRLRCIEAASAVMQHAKAPNEHSAQFAGNVLGLVNSFYAFVTGDKKTAGIDHLCEALSRKPEPSTPGDQQT